MQEKRKHGLLAKRLTALAVVVCLLFGMVPSGLTMFEALEVEAAELGIKGNGIGGIWIDIYGSIYKSKNYNNIAYTSVGCTWFAACRAQELTGVNTTIWSGSALWNNGSGRYGWSTGKELKAPALVCYSGHVAVVEKIEGDTVYISEGGSGYSDGDHGFCVIRTASKSQVMAGDSYMGSYLGCLYMPGAASSTPTGSVTTPTISTDLPSYIVNETAKISWAKSSTNCDFYQYWLVVQNLTENKQIFSGATGNARDVNANSANIKFGSAGEYKITVYAVPYDKTKQKVSTKTIKVEKEQYSSGVEPQASYIYNGHLYELYDHRATFAHARVTASQKGGHLVSITSSGEQTAVMNLIKGDSGWDYSGMGWYIGASDSAKEGTWKWDSGEAFSYKNWNTGEPNNAGGAENYAAVLINGKWNDVTGSGYFPYVVEYDTVDYNRFSPTKTATYDFDAGKVTYELYDNRVNVTDAKKIAAAKGGNLVAITSATEMQRITSLIQYSRRKNESSMYWYMGLSDAEKENVWKWDTGEAFSYSNWNSGEPNNNDGGAAENYAVIQTSGKWNDVTGAKRYGFIVERTEYNDLTVPTVTTNKDKYYITDDITVRWAKSPTNTDLSYYKLVVKNIDTNSTVYEEVTRKTNVNAYILHLPNAGKYQITVYAVPEHDPEKRQKVSSKTIEVTETPLIDWDISADIQVPSLIKAGDTFEVKVRLTSTLQLVTYLMDLQYDSELLEIDADSEKNKIDYDERNGVRNLTYEENMVRFVGASPSSFDWDSDFFTVVFRAKKDFYGKRNILLTLNTEDRFSSTTGEHTDLAIEKTVETTLYSGEWINGDVNDDGALDADDALDILKSMVGLIKLDGVARKAADVNADGNVDADDALDILKKLVGLLDF